MEKNYSSTITECASLLKKLVAIPSVNPDFPNLPEQFCGEERLAIFCRDLLCSWGISARLQKIAPRRPNLVATIGAKRNPTFRLLLAVHLDTVPPSENKFPKVVVKKGKLYGLGSADTKGSLAAYLLALKTLASSTEKLKGELTLVGTMGEEQGFDGARAFMEASNKAGEKYDAAIIGEPTSLDLVIAEKGVMRWEIKIKGKSAHGATPEKGNNAIVAAAKIIPKLEKDWFGSGRKKAHPLLGLPTVNVGLISGGTGVNVVPEICTIGLERRCLPGESSAKINRSLIEKIKAGLPTGFKVTVNQIDHADSVELATDHSLVKILLQAARREKRSASLCGVPWAADASVFAQAGIPSIVFGPGSIKQAHQPGEFIVLRQVQQAQQILEQTIKSLNGLKT